MFKRWWSRRGVRKFLAGARASSAGLTDAARDIVLRARLSKIKQLIRKLNLQREDAIDRVEQAKPIKEMTLADRAGAWLAVGFTHFFADATVQYLAIVYSVSRIPGPLALIAAVAIAAFLAGAVHALATISFRRPLRKFNLRVSVRVQASVDKHRAAFRVFFTAALASVLTLTVVRFLPAKWLGGLAQWGWIPFAVLVTSLPAAAGIATALGHFLSEPERAKSELREIDELLAQLNELLAVLKGKDPLSDDDPDPEDTPPAPAAGAAVLMVAMLALSFGVARASEKVCLVGADTTASVLESDRHKATEFIQRTLPEITTAYGCSHIVVAHFADAGRWTPRVEFAVPQASSPSDCSSVAPEPMEGLMGVFEELDNVREGRLATVTGPCELRNSELSKEHQRNLSRFFARVTKVLVTEASVEHTTTDILGLLEGVSQEPRSYAAVILVTDGLDRAHTLRHVELPEGVAATMVLTRPDPRYSTDAEVLANIPAWKRAVPGLRIVLVNELYEGFWCDISEPRGGS